jgi:O-antigen ligase
MLKETLIAGYGPDTFPMVFPQYDYVGKLNSFTSHRIIVDKPHNMYLQIGINTGVLSLVSLLAVFVIYAVDSFKVYFKREINTFIEYVGVGAFTGVMGYLAAGMFNDQIISVAPLFYVMLGLGLAVNRMVIRNSRETV